MLKFQYFEYDNIFLKMQTEINNNNLKIVIQNYLKRN